MATKQTETNTNMTIKEEKEIKKECYCGKKIKILKNCTNCTQEVCEKCYRDGYGCCSSCKTDWVVTWWEEGKEPLYEPNKLAYNSDEDPWS